LRVTNALRLLPGTVGYGTVLHSLRTRVLDEWNAKLDDACRHWEELVADVEAAFQAGCGYEFIATVDQSAQGGILCGRILRDRIGKDWKPAKA
jgi:hypothetical protein